MAEEPVAGVTDLHISFDGRPVVSGVSFELAAGECLALVGESGSGKTLTSRALLGLVPETAAVRSERLEIAGRDARRFTARQWQELRGSTVGLIAQDALVSLDPLRTVGREVAEALRVRRRRERARLTRTELDTAVAAELTHVAVPEPQQRMRQYAHELSGGLRQRALIASATITEPQLLIADEPTTALDRGVQAQVLQVLGRLKAEGAALLLISHDLAVVASIADQVAVMRAGEVVETGPVDAVLRQPSHDYTVTLLRAQPSAHSRGRRLSEQPRLELGPVSHSRETQPVVLAARGLRQSFRQPDGSRLQAVDEVSFELPAGQTLGIVGESGSGKTTVGRILLGLQPPEAGEVELAGELWTGVPERKRRPRRHLIQAIHQDPLSSFDPRVSVRSILTEALAIHGVARADRPERAAELLGWVGLSTDLLPRRPLTLSGGQRQRLAIARALAREPQVLICDEPVSALDVSVQAQVLDVFTDIQDQLGLAMVFISHDLGVVHHLSDEVLVMQQGVVVERGAAIEVFTDPQHSYTRSLLEALPELDVDPAVLVPTDPEPDPDEGSD